MRYKFVSPTVYDGVHYGQGQVYDLDAEVATALGDGVVQVEGNFEGKKDDKMVKTSRKKTAEPSE